MLEHFPNEEVFVKRIMELIKQVEIRNSFALTPFLSPDKQQILCQLVGKKLLIHSDGFYSDAERKRMVLVSEHYEAKIAFDLCQIVSSYQKKYVKVTHQDVLGALMNLGIDREQFGDIAISDSQVGIVVSKQQAAYICSQLSKIHQLSVSFVIQEEPVITSIGFQESTIIVSALRLDVMVAHLIHVSRKASKDMILSGFVKVNHSCIESVDKLCNNKDIISIRGHGRYLIHEVQGMSKKGNYVVAMKQYV